MNIEDTNGPLTKILDVDPLLVKVLYCRRFKVGANAFQPSIVRNEPTNANQVRVDGFNEVQDTDLFKDG